MSENENQDVNQKINIDTFLYSCLEYEKTQKSKGRWPLTVKWPPLSRRSTHPEETDAPVAELIKELITWYGNEFTNIRDNPLNLETLHDYTIVAVDMLNDISELYYIIKDTEIPSPTDSDPEAREFWGNFKIKVDEFFPKIANLLQEYANWSFRRPEQTSEDMSSMPPVGRNTPPAGSRISSDGYLVVPEGSRSGRGGGRGGNRGSGRSDRNGQGRGGRGDRNTQGRGGRGGNRGPNRGDRNGQGRGRGNNRQSQADREKLEAEALKAVITAINQLKENNDLSEIKLKPTNSFLRRMQHNEVNSQGFASHSVGEDRERAVVVTRAEA